jgi:hypothetical protein
MVLCTKVAGEITTLHKKQKLNKYPQRFWNCNLEGEVLMIESARLEIDNRASEIDWSDIIAMYDGVAVAQSWCEPMFYGEAFDSLYESVRFNHGENSYGYGEVYDYAG